MNHSFPPPVQATLILAGIPLEGKVTRIDKGILTLTLAGQIAEIPAGCLIEHLILRASYGKQVLVHAAHITRWEYTATETLLTIRTDDPASRAALWSLAYTQQHYYPGLHPSAEPLEEPSIPHRGHYSTPTWQERLDWLRTHSRLPLEQLGRSNLHPEQLRGNIENFIGAVEIPVGLAGPLLVHGQYAQGYCLAPLATTEGALVASACRGAKALSQSGGVKTQVIHQQMMRAPVFITETVAEALQLQRWVLDHRPELDEQIATGSRHARLEQIESFVLGASLHLRFIYHTGDAAGQNMTTACTWKACQWMLAQLAHYPDIRIRDFYIEANMSGDKKVNYHNYVTGRGIRVVAEAVLPDGILHQILKTNAETLLEGAQHFMAGSLQLGMVGFNINVANIIAAIFAATGQDIACVHESSIGQLSIRRHPSGIHASLVLPSLIIGTVGGGTGLPAQQECLQLMGCAGTGQVNKLAEIIAGFCLALDLSTLSAIVSGQFASAHERLGRNRPENGLKEEHLTPAFFQEIISCAENSQALHIHNVSPRPLDTGNSILSDLTANQLKKKAGHFLYDVHYQQQGAASQRTVVLKSKPTDHEVVHMLNQMAQACGNPLAQLYELHKFDTGFKNCHVRELEMYRLTDPRFTRIAPRTYKLWQDDSREIFVIAMEYLTDVSHLNTVQFPTQWTDTHIKIALRDIAAFHSIFLDQPEQWADKPWLHRPDSALANQLIPLWRALLNHHTQEFPELYTSALTTVLDKAIAAVPQAWFALGNAPRTVIHNDFNLRNVCLRPGQNGEYGLCVYDWELAALHVPQYDVCEFLAFVLPPEAPPQTRWDYLEYYRLALEKHSSRTFDSAYFRKIFDWACLDFACNRLSLYAMAHTFKCYDFFPRVLQSHVNYLAMSHVL